MIDHVNVVGGEMEETGDWDLDGLFVRLGAAIDSVGAKRVVIDTIEILFGAFSNTAILRSELRRLFGWLKDRGVTAVITGERGDGTLTRHGIEEYVSDCVIVLDHRVTEQTSTRRLRILKYRGSLHGTNEYPFLIGESGVSVLPITSLGLRHNVSTERVSTGVRRLDAMLGDGGFYKGSTVLVSGTAGTGKSTLAAQFCDAACARGERAMYFAFEESEAEIVRNMSSVGIDLRQWVDAGLLQFQCFRPSLLGLEAHLFAMQKSVGEFDPAVVVMDPISDLLRIGTGADVSAMLTRQVDFLKAKGVTALFTSLNSDAERARADQQDRVARRHLAAGQDHGGQRRAQPGAVRAQVARDGPLQPDPRVPAHRPGHRLAGRARARGGPDRLRPRRHGAAGDGRRAPGARGDRPEETAVRAEAPGEDGEGRLPRDRVPGGSGGFQGVSQDGDKPAGGGQEDTQRAWTGSQGRSGPGGWKRGKTRHSKGETMSQGAGRSERERRRGRRSRGGRRR